MTLLSGFLGSRGLYCAGDSSLAEASPILRVHHHGRMAGLDSMSPDS
jgi:hypothetical protein